MDNRNRDLTEGWDDGARGLLLYTLRILVFCDSLRYDPGKLCEKSDNIL